MVLIDNESFLRELTLLYQSSRNVGSVYLTMKKYDGRTKPRPKPYSTTNRKRKKPSAPEPVVHDLCLLRASNGKKKISTVVNAKDVNKFQMAYITTLRANLDGLKKRDRRKAKSSKSATST